MLGHIPTWFEFLILVFASIGFAAFCIFLWGLLTSPRDLEGY